MKITSEGQYNVISLAVFPTIILLLLSISSNGSKDFAYLEMRCEGSRKALFKDLDGSALGLQPPVSVFPKSEFEWTESCLHAGKQHMKIVQYLKTLAKSWVVH